MAEVLAIFGLETGVIFGKEKQNLLQRTALGQIERVCWSKRDALCPKHIAKSMA